MNIANNKHFTLDQFEGPLDLLLLLVQKHEVDIRTLSIRPLTTQLLELLEQKARLDIDSGAEYLSLTASLLLIKSRSLLPRDDPTGEIEEVDPRHDMLAQIVDYCHLREIASVITARDEQQRLRFARGLPDRPPPSTEGTGLESFKLDDLFNMVEAALQRSLEQSSSIITEEPWRVEDAIANLRRQIVRGESLPFTTLLSTNCSRDEVVVTFLAILELTKLQEVSFTISEERELIIRGKDGT